ncbi:hypothetical protein LHP98_13290 [Rhodobacter sp. Har01]|uniref:hypothetical protein n=1 Tax=Rhodobacter sp. Har01 TaxID=2883999 RepID=UPI001D08E216|nr:hypothetical protein [Rhodobacter sp. Har01]MCB6179093.1 hypothetical protein [Rhodobacter sp. Har01]
MKPLLNTIAVLALMAGPALAQDQADLDAFGIEDDGASLDALVPDDGGAAPMVTDPEEGAAPAVAEAPPAEVPAAPAAPEVAGFEPPADWSEKSLAGYSFRHPGDWTVMQDEHDTIMIFNGDMSAQEGAMFGLATDRPENVTPPEAEILSETAVTVAGQPFRRLEMTAMLGPTQKAEILMLVSDQPVDGSDHLLVTGLTVGRPLDDYREVIGQMMATLRYAPAQAEPETALGGLVVYALPEGWNKISNASGFVIYPPVYSASITVLKGDAVNGPGGLMSEIPADALRGRSTVLGNPAQSLAWQGSKAEYVQGNAMVPGYFTLHLLDQCAPDGQALAVVATGVPETLESEEFTAALAGIGLAEGVQLVACGAGATIAPAAPSAAPGVAAVPPPPDGAGAASGLALPVQVEVAGVTYRMPEGWQITFEDPDEKMWASPDGRFSIMSFWWFPDEPLLGYSDIVSVENVIIDHEPVTRIVHSYNNIASIQNVTERARGDGRRFIFTLDTGSASQDELKALHDQLVATLRFGAGFVP